MNFSIPYYRSLEAAVTGARLNRWISSTDVVERILQDHIFLPPDVFETKPVNRRLPVPFRQKNNSDQGKPIHHNVSYFDQSKHCWLEANMQDFDPPESILPPHGFEQPLYHSVIPHRELHLSCRDHIIHFSPIFLHEFSWPSDPPQLPHGKPLNNINLHQAMFGSISIGLCKSQTFIKIEVGGSAIRIRLLFPAEIIESYRFPSELGIFIFFHLALHVPKGIEEQIILVEVSLDPNRDDHDIPDDFSQTIPKARFGVCQLFLKNKDWTAMRLRLEDTDFTTDSMYQKGNSSTVVKFRNWWFYLNWHPAGSPQSNIRGDTRETLCAKLILKLDLLSLPSVSFASWAPPGIFMKYYDSWSVGDVSYQVERVSKTDSMSIFRRARRRLMTLQTNPYDPPTWTKLAEDCKVHKPLCHHLIFQEDVPHLYISGLTDRERPVNSTPLRVFRTNPPYPLPLYGKPLGPPDHCNFVRVLGAFRSPTKTFDLFGKLGKCSVVVHI
jgi:hypothetical protein